MSFCVERLGAYIDPVEELQRGYVRHTVVPTAYNQRTRPLPSPNPTADSCHFRHVDALTAVDILDTDTGDAVAIKHHGSSENSGRKKKRKRRHTSPNAAEINAIRRHEEIRPFIEAAHSLFLPMYTTAKSEAAKRTETLSPPPIPSSTAEVVMPRISMTEVEAMMKPGAKVGQSADVRITSSGALHQPGSDESDDTILLSMGATWQSQLCQITIPKTGVEGPLFGRVVGSGVEGEEVEAEALGREWVLPPNSRFLISPFPHLDPLYEGGEGGYNLILVDPPWENRSVQRNGGYATLPNRPLLGLPVKRLSGSGGALVGVWVTNREKLRRFVEEELLPAWQVQYVATWIWLKVSVEGQMLSQLDNNHHRPYEVLVLGYTTDVQIHPLTSPKTEREEAKFTGGKSDDNEMLRKNTSTTFEASDFGISGLPPHGYVVMSVPGEHSRKPPLARLLRPYVPTQGSQFQALELFARELLPGWTSWGNEPLRFQSSKYIQTNK